MQTLYARINTGLLVFIAVTGIVIATMMATRSSAGPLDPSGTPAPPMKTLQQVEPRTPIDHLPFAITQTGSYYLTGNLTVAPLDTDGITVNANHVIIDLNGFQLLGAGGTGCPQCTGSGIIVPAGTFYGLTVKNGTLGNWHQGIEASNARQGQFSDLVISGNHFGLHMGESSDAQRINASYNTNNGVDLGSHDSVIDSTFFQNVTGIQAVLGINGGHFLNNEVDGGLSSGIVVYGSDWRVEGNNASGNVGDGVFINGNHNMVVRNSATGNSNGNFFDGGGNYMPIETAPTVTNPLSNVSY
jgi:hypothetical protein